ncbi:hypothetical protein BX666DRAFT_1896170 [Dichotomocladium elegans]|nr:hypothetical protein BX666DRAFT_1896170 [Dichotomocladium elegans]
MVFDKRSPNGPAPPPEASRPSFYPLDASDDKVMGLLATYFFVDPARKNAPSNLPFPVLFPQQHQQPSMHYYSPLLRPMSAPPGLQPLLQQPPPMYNHFPPMYQPMYFPPPSPPIVHSPHTPPKPSPASFTTRKPVHQSPYLHSEPVQESRSVSMPQAASPQVRSPQQQHRIPRKQPQYEADGKTNRRVRFAKTLQVRTFDDDSDSNDEYDGNEQYGSCSRLDANEEAPGCRKELPMGKRNRYLYASNGSSRAPRISNRW